ncbi:MAG: LPS-assembly protein LptD [bacterium]
MPGTLLVALGAPVKTLAAEENWNCSVVPDGTWQCFAPGYQPSRKAPPARIPTTKKYPSKPATQQTSAVSTVDKQDLTEVPAKPVDQPAESSNETAARPAILDISPWMASIDHGLQWQHCGTSINPGSFYTPGITTETQVDADAAELDQVNQQARFSGNVQMSFENQLLLAENLSYNRQQNRVSSEGHVLLHAPAARIAGDNIEYDLGNETGSLDNTEFRLFNPAARGTAALAEFLGNNQSRYQDVSFTTCPPGNEDFQLSAERLEVDRNAMIARFEAARVRFLGVPVFYVPKMSISLDNQRKSGFLMPSVGYRSRTGVDIATPYYFNLAPNYDATLTPRIMSKRGFALGGEFRYLSRPHQGEFRAEVLPHDRDYKNGEARGALYVKQQSVFSPNFSGSIVASAVSDQQYLQDLGDSLAVSGTRFLPRNARLDYRTRHWDLSGRLQYFQVLDETITGDAKPYARLPQLRADMVSMIGPGGLDYSFLSEYVYFYRSSGLTAHRAYINPGVGYPMRSSWGYIEPRVSANYTAYALNNQEAGQDDSLDRTVGQFSLDTGLFFDREATVFSQHVSQTLEPRLFYLYTPSVDQDDLPIFDTGQFDFNFDNLFRLNRFNGIDRIGDANQLTLALTTRLQTAATGTEILKASIGQIYYFDDREITLPGDAVDDTSSSPLYAEISGRVSDHWWYRAGTEYDPHADQDHLRQGLVQLLYRDGDNRYLNATYRLRRDVVEQTDLAMLWPVTNNISVIGRWNYSLLRDKTLETLAGLEYGECCWRVRTLVRQYLDDDEDNQNLAFMIELELNGLGAVGNNIRTYLEDNLYGYRNDEE